MGTGNANPRLGISAIFHSKILQNDERPSASSRLVRAVKACGREARATNLEQLQGLAMRPLICDLSPGSWRAFWCVRFRRKDETRTFFPLRSMELEQIPVPHW